jgi:hypothetical protein
MKKARLLENAQGVSMSAVYNPESDTIAQIERLELEARDIRRRLEQARADEDKRVLSRQLKEVEQHVAALRTRLP